MTSVPPTTSTAPKHDAKNTPLWVAATANEQGHLTGLEAHAEYFVVRKPTQQLTRERSKMLVDDVKAFLHEQRVLAERQTKEIQEKYGEPAKARVQELRTTLEKRFDELAKDFEARVEKLESRLRPEASSAGETPGELPTGASQATTTGATTDSTEASKSAAPKKKPATK